MATTLALLGASLVTAQETDRFCAENAQVRWDVDLEGGVVRHAIVDVPGCEPGEAIGLRLLTNDGDAPEGDPLMSVVEDPEGRATFDLDAFALHAEQVEGVAVYLGSVGPVTPALGVCVRHQGGMTFPDSPGSGHQFFIDCLAELRIVQGFTDGWFRPRNDVTRAQLASYVARSIELATTETMTAGGALFVDVAPGSTHGPAIYKLRAAGIIQGYPDGRFGPAGSVTREQTARYVVNALEWVLGEPLATSGARFPDVPVGNQYAMDIDKLVTAQVIAGFTDGTFQPRQPVTRAQMARFVANALEVLNDRGAYHGP